MPSMLSLQTLKWLMLAGTGLVAGAPQFGPIGPAHGPLHHRAPLHHDPYVKVPPRPFAYEYGVQVEYIRNVSVTGVYDNCNQDAYSGADFAKKEIQDEYGVVTGEYRVALPDGRIQIVTYRADHEGGFIADVKYEGAAVYPQGPHHGPGPYAPAHPAPLAHRPHHAAHGPGPLFG